MGGILATAGTTMAAFQIVDMSATSGESGAGVAIRVDGSHRIGGSERSQLFLVPRKAYEASPEPARCDEIPGATVVGELQWEAATVEFQGKTYPGFVGTGSFTVPDVTTGIYVVAGVVDNPYTGCHVFAPFGVGMDLPDTATAISGALGRVLRIAGFVLLAAGVLLARCVRREPTPVE